ncbi:IS110 family transposase [Candidatus Fermentibacteria bacterium]|nr:IS110 family transposase [Candidatus Fermentibacteria bacterium]
MDVMYARCAGIDVHKQNVKVNVRVAEGGGVEQETRTFGTMTRELVELGEWLEGWGVTHVAMESTGVYWKPLYNLLEGRFEVLICNAHHVKQVPGRKTDVRDCQWLAQLLQHGLLRGSFIPPRPHRELRDLTRHRTQVTAERARVVNRMQKVLEDGNIKLSAVASDIMGVSGQAMITAIIGGEDDAGVLAEKARRRLRRKLPELRMALEGKVTDHHRFMLGTLYRHWQYLGEVLVELTARIETVLRSDELSGEREGEEGIMGFTEAVELLVSVPGIDVRSAEAIVAEIGTDMSQFPTAGHLASWAGVCPGNNESAGKRRTGKTTKGNRWLRGTLTQVAWAASRTRNTYLSEQHRRLARRRGKKRAQVALAHSILATIYYMLTRHQLYEDLGADYFDRLNNESLVTYHLKRLASLGHHVSIEPQERAA